VDQTGTISVVITDTSVLINLAHTGHLRLLGSTPGFRFLLSEEVLAEIQDPAQREMVDTVILNGFLALTRIETTSELAFYAEFTRTLGAGESACLALASNRGWLIACDERRVFLREALARIGKDRLINTPGLYLLWIRCGLLTVAEADAAKLTLESRRFKMAFSSYRDLV